MSEPDRDHVGDLRTFRERLVKARRQAVQQLNKGPDISATERSNATATFDSVQARIEAIDRALADEMKLAPSSSAVTL